MTTLTKVGYWYNLNEPGYPHAQDHVDPNWDAETREKVLAYLKKGLKGNTYRGFSRCRFCQCPNGASDLTDGVYVWPSGFAHYLEQHQVKPPKAFIDHVLKKISQKVNV